MNRNQGNEFYKKALALYKKSRIFLVGSLDEDGCPNVKAVTSVVVKKPDMSEIVIKTNTTSQHVQQFKKNPQGCLYFYSLLGFKGTLLKGTFRIMEEATDKDQFWKKGDEKYYGKGYQDYCLMAFTPQTGRHYSKIDSGDFEMPG